MTWVYWGHLVADSCTWVLTLGPVLTTPYWHVLLKSSLFFFFISFYDPVRGKAVESGYFCDPIVNPYQSINPYSVYKKIKRLWRKSYWIHEALLKVKVSKQSKCADGEEQIAPLWQCPLFSLYVCVHVYLCMCIFFPVVLSFCCKKLQIYYSAWPRIYAHTRLRLSIEREAEKETDPDRLERSFKWWHKV